MTRILRLVSAMCVSVAVMSVAEPLVAQTPATASEFYMQYRKVFASAKKVEELLPYMSAATKKQVESTPAAERAQMFEMVKMMGDQTNVKIVKETRTPTGATLASRRSTPTRSRRAARSRSSRKAPRSRLGARAGRRSSTARAMIPVILLRPSRWLRSSSTPPR